MTQIKRLPIELLRNMPLDKQSEYIFKYHALCTKKYDWFVRPKKGEAYYTLGERPKLQAGVEVFNCNWTPEQWNTRPYRHFYNPVQDAVYESFARYDLPSLDDYGYGWSREDSLILKNGKPWYYGMFRDNGGNTSAHWWVESGDIWITHNGSHTHYYGINQKHKQGGTFMMVVEVKKPIIEPIMKAAKAMDKPKYKGVYQPFIDRLIELYGLNRTQI